MRELICLFTALTLMSWPSPATYAADLQFNQVKYDRASEGDRAVYKLATKGFRGDLVGSTSKVFIDHTLLGCSREEVIKRIGDPSYNKKDLFMYFASSPLDKFQVVIMHFNRKNELRFISFPVGKHSTINPKIETIEGLFGSAPTQSNMKRIYTSDDDRKTVTFMWNNLSNRFESVLIGRVTPFDLFKMIFTHSRALYKVNCYWGKVLDECLRILRLFALSGSGTKIW